MIERLTELLRQCMTMTCDKQAKFLIDNGVIAPPVKVGDTVYDISEFLDGTNSPEIYEYKADEITISRLNGEMVYEVDSIFMRHKDFGVAFFLTREEAEAALW